LLITERRNGEGTRIGYKALVADDDSVAVALFVERSAEIDVVVAGLVMRVVSGSLLVQVLGQESQQGKNHYL
jgi:hypothetical protein